MSEAELKDMIIKALAGIAPEADADDLEPDEDFRDQMDFDSMDFMNFTIALSEQLKIEIPAADTPQLSSLEGCLSYLKPRLNIS